MTFEPRNEWDALWASRLTFGHVAHLVRYGFGHKIELEHLGDMMSCDRSEAIRDRVVGEKGGFRPGSAMELFRVLFSSHSTVLVVSAVCRLVADVLSLVNPVLLSLVLQWFESEEKGDWNGIPLGYCYAFLLLLSSLVMTSLLQWHHHLVIRLGIHLRTFLRQEVFAKAVVMEEKALAEEEKERVQAVSCQSVDAEAMMRVCFFMHYIWSIPMLLVVIAVLLYNELQLAGLAGYLFMVLFIPLQIQLVKIYRKLSGKSLKFTDRRVKLVKEMIHSVKLVKIDVLEEYFQEKVTSARSQELVKKQTVAVYDAFNRSLTQSATIIVSVIAFVTYAAIGEEPLTAQKAFTSLALFNTLRLPMNVTPMCAQAYGAAIASAGRLQRFFSSPEIKPYVRDDCAKGEAVSFRQANIKWSAAAAHSVLKQVDLSIPSGRLTVIHGRVGSGKTLLVSAIIGDVALESGEVSVSRCGGVAERAGEEVGGIAYCAQRPFILNATVQSNILFGAAMIKERYEVAIWASCLGPDLVQLPKGDLTQIGERGVNLSGGQKARIALARALYRKSPSMYVFDDVLSALDVHVTKTIIRRCFDGILKGRTCIVTTNSTALNATAAVKITIEGGAAVAVKDPEGSETEEVENGREQVDEGIEEKLKVYLETESITNAHVQRATSMRFQSEQHESDREDDSGNAAEFREVGTVKSSMYWAYFKALGKCRFACIIAFLLGHNAFFTGSGLWLASWSESGEESDALTNAGIYSAIALASIVLATCGAVLWAFGSIQAATRLHARMLIRIAHAPMLFFETTPAGRVLNRFASDTTEMDSQLPRTLLGAIRLLFQLVFIVVLQAVVLPFILIAYIPLVALYVILMEFYRRTYREVNRIQNVTRSPIFSVLGEAIAGASTLRAYGSIDRFMETSIRRNEVNAQAMYKKNCVNRYLGLRLDWMGVTLSSVVVFVSVAMHASVGAGLAGLVITYSFQITGLLNWLVRMATESESYMNAVERIVEYSTIDIEGPPIIPENRPPPNWPSKGELVFENVSLRYGKHLPLVLHGLSFKVPGSMHLGVCGRTGSGKSSLLSCLLRLVDAEPGGKILLDGVDTGKIGLKDLRQGISLVPQDPILFDGTLRRNLDQTNAHTDEQVWEALRAVSLDKEVKGGLDMQVGEGGNNWSCGERQLLCFARVLLRKGHIKVLCLDEATSSVDAESDAKLQHALLDNFKDCTVITIAHRLQTILSYQSILVMKDGRISEMGNPQQLLADPSTALYSMVNPNGGADTSRPSSNEVVLG